MIARQHDCQTAVLDDLRTTHDFSSMLEAAIPNLKQFIRHHSGRVIRARECDSDIAQSVCREAVIDRAQFRYGGRRGLHRWLFTRARRKIQDRVRYYTADRRDVARETPLHSPDPSEPGVLHEPVAATRPDEVVIEREVRLRLESALEQLPVEYREVVTLARLEGLSHAEIAERLGRSESATRKILHRALARLAQVV